jgi:asparagine synthase (glutamine-hydrolysing)
MCGITALFNAHCYKYEDIQKAFLKGKARGPEYSNSSVFNNVFLGFHRLAINGLDEKSHQPLTLTSHKCHLICNGEIYNWRKLKNVLKDEINYQSNSDCEIILHLYIKYGIEHTLQLLDGVFAFVLLDFEDPNCPKAYIARDPYGVRPLFYMKNQTDVLGFSSEIKMLYDLNKYDTQKFAQLTPGTFWELKLFNNSWKCNYIKTFAGPIAFTNPRITDDNVSDIIRKSLFEAVSKRVDNTDREITCLLSGGLDSSLITALVAKMLPNPKMLHTWSIGMTGSEDLKYAKIVADHIGTTHHEVILSEKDFLEAIPQVIYAIESYDTTSVRASVGNWLIAKAIRENSDAKVVFNGDGSDELTGGYMYFHLAPDEIEFDKECRRLLSDIHYFDVLRSDRSIASHGLEARTPFLDRGFVDTYLSIPRELRYHPKHNQPEKYLLRKSFDGMDFLPHEILWRGKEAFSDGISKHTRSWFEIIQDHALTKVNIKCPKLAEKTWYKQIFDSHFSNCSNVIPYLWMPKYVDADDASARTLDVYKRSNHGKQSNSKQSNSKQSNHGKQSNSKQSNSEDAVC